MKLALLFVFILLIMPIALADVKTNSSLDILCQFLNLTLDPINSGTPDIRLYFPPTNTTPFLTDVMTYINTGEGKYNYTVQEGLLNATGFNNIVCNISASGIQTANFFVTDNPINDTVLNISTTVNNIEGDFVAWEIAVSLGLGILAFTFGFISTKFEGKHKPLQVMFLIFASFIGLSAAAVMLEVATIESQTNIDGILTGVYTGFVWFVVLLVAYFVMMELFEWLNKAGKLGRWTR